MNLIKESVDLLTARGVEFSSRFMPYFTSSVGCHYFNLMNRKKKIFHSLGRTPDSRMQIVFTAPPGWSKSLFLKQHLNSEYGISNTGEIPTRFMGSCTEAAWTGSVDGTGVNAVKSMGQAEKYAVGIIGMEEFAAFTAVMKQEHSKHLEQALAMSLFEGDVEKDLKNVTISYHTDVTIWAGNQILRFDLSGGLFRRFFHIFWVPRIDESNKLKIAVWRGDNVKLDRPRLTNYRLEIRRMARNLDNVKYVSFDDSVKKALDNVPHFEQIIYRNFILGYNIMAESDVPERLTVTMDSESEKLLKQAIMWRKQLLADPSGFQVLCLVNDLCTINGSNEVAWDVVRDSNLLYSVDHENTDNILWRLVRSRKLKYDNVKHSVSVRVI